MTDTKIIQLDDKLLECLKNIQLESSKKMVYGGSNRTLDRGNGHWNSPLLGGNLSNPTDHELGEELYRNTNLLKLWITVKQHLKNRNLIRCYVSSSAYGNDALVHTDDYEIKELHGEHVESTTIVIFLNEEWKKEWAGEFILFNSDDEIETAVLPKFGKAVIFDASKPHVGRSVSRIYGGLRTILVMRTCDLSAIKK
jgi:hypothetical protein